MANQKISIKRAKKDLIITIEEQVSVQHIDEIYTKLQSLKFDRNNIIFQLADVSDPDLAFIQMLISLKRSKLQKKQKITLKAPLDRSIKNVILDSVNEIQFATL